MSISSILSLIPAAFLLVLLGRLFNWIYLTFVVSSKPLDLTIFGGNGRSKRASWALITGASDGIGAAFAKVKE